MAAFLRCKGLSSPSDSVSLVCCVSAAEAASLSCGVFASVAAVAGEDVVGIAVCTIPCPVAAQRALFRARCAGEVALLTGEAPMVKLPRFVASTLR